VSRRARAAILRVLVVAIFFGALEAICRLGLVRPTTLVAPSAMVAELWKLLTAGTLAGDAARTATEVGGGFAVSVVLGLACGAVVHARPGLRAAIQPVLASWYSVPSFVFYPLLVALLGLTAAPLIVIGAIAGTPAMMIGTIAGLDRVPRVLLRVARVHRLSPVASFRLVTLPAISPSLFTGLKLAFAYAFISVIAGGVHPGRGRARLQHLLRLREFRDPQDVRADAVRAAGRGRRERWAVVVGGAHAASARAVSAGR